MIAPVNRLKKDEIVWLGNHKCKKHSHTYLEHYQCYEKEEQKPERIGFIDIEASGLVADFGILISYCIKDSLSKKIFEGEITKEEILTGKMDKRVTQQCINDMLQFDRLVGFYSNKFDIPFLRTRALTNNLEFPAFRRLKHTDVYPMAKFKLKLHSNRQENVCRVILGKTDKTHLDSKYWLGALRGDKKSLHYILDHNRRDVTDLEKIYWKLQGFVGKNDTSI
jgi:uncharacterized protein YprB with RNaseH-like and TPR domain